jgi:hypothetical protein
MYDIYYITIRIYVLLSAATGSATQKMQRRTGWEEERCMRPGGL